MELDETRLIGIVRKGFIGAVGRQYTVSTPQALHAARSRTFVESVAGELRLLCSANERVFSKYFRDSRKDFGFNEFMYDIHACEVIDLNPPRGGPFKCVVKSIVEVESEFLSGPKRQSHGGYQSQMADFQKLCIGNAAFKVFIGGLGDTEPRSVLDVFHTVASHCGGKLIVVLLPHPRSWGKRDALDRFFPYVFENGTFIGLS